MATTDNDLNVSVVTLIAAWLLVIALEAIAGLANAAGLAPLPATFLTRILQTVFVLVLVRVCQANLSGIGLTPGTYCSGLTAGLYWSIAFGGLAAVVGTALLVTGVNPLAIFHMSSPKSGGGIFCLYITGAVIAPIAEEIVFRGITYGFFRRWGKIAGIVLSTICFVLLHSPQSLPVTQIVGGVVFCLAYEKEKSLLVPIVIHMLGNAALFTLGLL